jgi:uncharacterized protein (DUF433 family)
MAILDWSQCAAVESVPGKVSGAWVFRNTRLPVATVIENLEDMSVDEVMEQFDVTREQIQAVLDFVARSLQPAGIAAPEWLQTSWESARQLGLDNLSAEEIDAEIAAARKARRDRRPVQQ